MSVLGSQTGNEKSNEESVSKKDYLVLKRNDKIQEKCIILPVSSTYFV